MVPSAEVIRSRTNPLVKRLRTLKEQGERGVVLVEGPKLLEEAALSHVHILEVAASPRIERSARGHRLLRELAAAGTAIRWVHEDILASLSEAEVSQGVVALARRPVFPEADLFRGTAPLLVVAAGLQNPGNLGGLLRTAEAAGASGAVLTAGTADPFSWKALRGSMGSAFRLPHVAGGTLPDFVQRAKSLGLRIAATDPEAPVPYYEADLRHATAFLFGNEGSGLPEEVLRAADLRLRIPMAAPVDSLNVGVAGGILLFEAARQRRGGAAAPVPRGR
jgi:TrmH family RNA methyltransferase